MYYKILLNGKSIGVVGHPRILNMHLSLQVVDDESTVFASAVCSENGERYFIDWLQKEIAPKDIVEFRQVSTGDVLAPRNKYKMNRRNNE